MYNFRLEVWIGPRFGRVFFTKSSGHPAFDCLGQGWPRFARWYIFKPKIQIWVNFGGACYGRCRHILSTFGQFSGHLVYPMTLGGHLVYSVLVYCTAKNLATLGRPTDGPSCKSRSHDFKRVFFNPEKSFFCENKFKKLITNRSFNHELHEIGNGGRRSSAIKWQIIK
jgi:hypothetical protein